MEYTIHGPFKMTKSKSGLVDKSNRAKKEFWDKVEKTEPCLPSSSGCYLFAIRAGKGIKPWYVGVASRQPFRNECFAPHKIIIYDEALVGKKGTPLLFFVAKRTKRGKFVKPGKNASPVNAYLETILIGAALDKNPKVMNMKKTKFLKGMCVPGLLNTRKKKPSQSEAEFKKAIH
jgi:hypothetical protein